MTGVGDFIKGVHKNMTGVDEMIIGVGENVKGVENNITGVRKKITGVGDCITGAIDFMVGVIDFITGVDSFITGVGRNITGVDDDKLYFVKKRPYSGSNRAYDAVFGGQIRLCNALNPVIGVLMRTSCPLMTETGITISLNLQNNDPPGF